MFHNYHKSAELSASNWVVAFRELVAAGIVAEAGRIPKGQNSLSGISSRTRALALRSSKVNSKKSKIR